MTPPCFIGTVDIATPPKCKTNTWVVAQTLTYVSRLFGVKITVMPGLRTDGASIPRFFWRVIGHPFSSWCIAAALIHDAIYATHLLTKAEADAIFREALVYLGAPVWKVKAAYYAVKYFGGNAWEEKVKHPKAITKARRFVEIEPLVGLEAA